MPFPLPAAGAAAPVRFRRSRAAGRHTCPDRGRRFPAAAWPAPADDEEEDHVNLEETAKRKAKWEEAHYNIISMKDDFKTIYGYDVEKVPFHF